MNSIRILPFSILALLALAGCSVEAGAPGVLSCSFSAFGTQQVWLLDAPAAGELDVQVDTIAPGTAFDPALRVVRFETAPTSASQIDSGSTLGSADDSFECTFPPPSFECPRVTTTLSDASPIAVAVRAVGSCAGGVGEYDVIATLDGQPVGLTFLGNDR